MQIIRTYSAGVFAGDLESRSGREGVIRNARRIWAWSGAASLSELAVKGPGDPERCRFPVTVDRILVTEIIEVIDCTPAAEAAIDAVPIWSAQPPSASPTSAGGRQ